MGEYAKRLLQLIGHHHLDDRFPELRQVRWLIENRKLSEGAAQAYLIKVESLREELRDHPNALHRPPTEKELYADGPPDVEIGALIENGLRGRDSDR